MTRGDVVRFPAPRGARGHEQQGARYGVIVQADELELLSTVIVAPTSTRPRETSFRPRIRVLELDTLVLTEHLQAVDRRRLGDPIARVSPAEIEAIDDALRQVLSLSLGLGMYHRSRSR